MDDLWGVPSSWAWTQLGEVGAIVAGGTPSTKIPEYWGGSVHWISPADLTGYGSKTIARGAKNITPQGLEKSSAKLMPTGSVHFSSRAPIGYVVISSSTLCTNQGFKSVVPATGVFNEYVYYYLKSIKHVANERATGTTFKEISGAAFSKLPLALPPINEQHRIVAKIEELFSELDKGVESLKTALEQLKIYRQSLLKHAFEGKLTAQWRADNADKLESSEELLARIQREREARHQQQMLDWEVAVVIWEGAGKEGKKPVKPRSLRPFRLTSNAEIESMNRIPDVWVWTRFENLIKFLTSGSRGWAKYYSISGAVFIRAQNLKRDKLNLTELAFVSLPSGSEGQRTLTQKNDILITITGANVTKTALVEKDLGEAYVSQHVALTRLVNTSYASYFFHYLVAQVAGRRQLESAAYGAGKPGLNLDNIRDVLVAVPSVEESIVVAERLDSNLSIVDSQIEELNVALKTNLALRQSILKKAFSGQLVPQDPSDEPACELLARIAAERAEAALAKKAKPAGKARAKKATHKAKP